MKKTGSFFKWVFVAGLFVACCSFLLPGTVINTVSPAVYGGGAKGKHMFCFSDEVNDTSKRFHDFLLQIDISKRTFQYEIISQSLSPTSKWVTYTHMSGKLKKKEENEFLLSASSCVEKTKGAGHFFSEKKLDAPEKMIFNFKTRSLRKPDEKRTVNFYKCTDFPKDSLKLYYEHWKN